MRGEFKRGVLNSYVKRKGHIIQVAIKKYQRIFLIIRVDKIYSSYKQSNSVLYEPLYQRKIILAKLPPNNDQERHTPQSA